MLSPLIDLRYSLILTILLDCSSSHTHNALKVLQQLTERDCCTCDLMQNHEWIIFKPASVITLICKLEALGDCNLLEQLFG